MSREDDYDRPVRQRLENLALRQSEALTKIYAEVKGTRHLRKNGRMHAFIRRRLRRLVKTCAELELYYESP